MNVNSSLFPDLFTQNYSNRECTFLIFQKLDVIFLNISPEATIVVFVRQKLYLKKTQIISLLNGIFVTHTTASYPITLHINKSSTQSNILNFSIAFLNIWQILQKNI